MSSCRIDHTGEAEAQNMTADSTVAEIEATGLVFLFIRNLLMAGERFSVWHSRKSLKRQPQHMTLTPPV